MPMETTTARREAPSFVVPDPYFRNVSTRLNFVTSYPKSGNTWIRLVASAYALTDTERLFDYVQYDDIQPFCFQAVSPIPLAELGVGAEMQLRPASLLVLAHFLRGPTLVKSHHARVKVNDMPLWTNQFCRRVIVVVRDPRGVCPSLAEHMGLSQLDAADFMANSQAIIGGDDKMHHVLGSWSDHVYSWTQADDVAVHIVRYEDLHAEPLAHFTEILEFLGVPELDTERLEAAIEFTSFERMQELEDKHGFGEKSNKAERFFRRGDPMGWKDELDRGLQNRIADQHHEMMQQFDYA